MLYAVNRGTNSTFCFDAQNSFINKNTKINNEGSNSASGMVACAPVTRRPRVQSPSRAGEACGDLLLAVQHWRLCISRGSYDRVNGGAVSLTLSGT